MRSPFLKKCHKVRLLLAALCGLAFTSHLDAIKTADELARFERQVQREMTHPTAHLKKVLATYKALRHAHLEAGGQGAEARMRQMIDNMRTAIRAAKTQGSPHLQRSLRGMNPFTGHQVTIHVTRPPTTPRPAAAALMHQHHQLQAAHAQLLREHAELTRMHGAERHRRLEVERNMHELMDDLSIAGSLPGTPRPRSARADVHPNPRIPTPPPTPVRPPHTPAAASRDDLMQAIRNASGTPRRRNPSPEPAAGGHDQPAAHIGGMLNQIQQAGAAMHQHHATEHAAGHHIGPQPGQRSAHGNIQQQMMNHPMFQAVTAANQDDENEDDDLDW